MNSIKEMKFWGEGLDTSFTSLHWEANVKAYHTLIIAVARSRSKSLNVLH